MEAKKDIIIQKDGYKTQLYQYDVVVNLAILIIA
jgi:hypothetical protein